MDDLLRASPHNCVCGLRPIFRPIRAGIKGGNTYSIPAQCACQIVRCCLRKTGRQHACSRFRSSLWQCRFVFSIPAIPKSGKDFLKDRDKAVQCQCVRVRPDVKDLMQENDHILHPGCRGALYMRPGAGASSAASRADMQSAPTGCGARFLRVRRAACPHAAAAACNKGAVSLRASPCAFCAACGRIIERAGGSRPPPAHIPCQVFVHLSILLLF